MKTKGVFKKEVNHQPFSKAMEHGYEELQIHTFSNVHPQINKDKLTMVIKMKNKGKLNEFCNAKEVMIKYIKVEDHYKSELGTLPSNQT